MCKLSRDLYNRTCAFVRTMEATCIACLRPTSYCYNCDLRTSRSLLAELSDASRPVEKQMLRKTPPSFRTRCDFYLAAVSAAKGWITARKIDPSNSLCGRGLKYWTLRKMVKMGLLKTYCDGKTIYFSLTKRNPNENNSTRN